MHRTPYQTKVLDRACGILQACHIFMAHAPVWKEDPDGSALLVLVAGSQTTAHQLTCAIESMRFAFRKALTSQGNGAVKEGYPEVTYPTINIKFRAPKAPISMKRRTKGE